MESTATISMVPSWALLFTVTTPPLLIDTPAGVPLIVQKKLPSIS